MTEEKKQAEETATTRVQKVTAPVEEIQEKEETQASEKIEKEESATSEKKVAPKVEKEEAKVEVKTKTKKEDPLKEEFREFEEEVIRLEDLSEETEYSKQEIDLMTQMYDKTLHEIKQGDIVKGKILDVTDSDVLVDIGFKSEGIIPGDEFDNLKDVKIGEEIEVFLENVEDPNGQMVLSVRHADFIRVWENVVQKFENNETIVGTIVRRIKGGMVVSLKGVDAFLPGSQIDVKPIRDFDAYLGREMEYKIVKVNHARRNIVVSSRVLIEKEMESQRSDIIKTIEKGQVRKGNVKNITDFGVFVDLGGVDGLLHITDLSWGRVNHPSEVVKLDEDIEVVILDFNENKDRISLGRKQLMPHPWENVEEKYPVGKVITGKVVSLTDYGAFIELETGIEGLIHISEMSWSQHIKHPSQLLHVGMEVEAKVLNVESDEKKISLGLKQLEPDPWEQIDTKFPEGSKYKGVVRNLTQFGAFVELEEGIDGLVHISDLSWTKKIRHPSEVVKKGDEIEVVVLGVNREERRIALGHKQVEENPWDAFEAKYNVDTETKGIVSRIIDKGIIITLPLGVDGFIPINHLGHAKLKKASDFFKPGDEVPAKVIEFDKDNKKIVLSITNYFKDKEENEWSDYLSKQGVEKTTMQELIKEAPVETKSQKAKPAKEEAKVETADKEKVKDAEPVEPESLVAAKADSQEEIVAEADTSEKKKTAKKKSETSKEKDKAEAEIADEKIKDKKPKTSKKKTDADGDAKVTKKEKKA